MTQTQYINVIVHIKSAHEGLSFDCTSCDKSFPRKDKLESHIKIVHSNPLDLDSNEKRITKMPEENIICELCGKSFRKKFDLKRHIQSIHEEMKFKCEFCSKEFSQPGSLKIHVQRYHKKPGDSSVFYQCDQCGKSFMQNYDLKRHIARDKFEFMQFHEFDTLCLKRIRILDKNAGSPKIGLAEIRPDSAKGGYWREVAFCTI